MFRWEGPLVEAEVTCPLFDVVLSLERPVSQPARVRAIAAASATITSPIQGSVAYTLPKVSATPVLSPSLPVNALTKLE